MRKFNLVQPSSLKDLVSFLARGNGQIALLAGGTDLYSLLKDEIMKPEIIVDLSPLKERAGLKQEKDFLRIGALTTINDLVSSPIIQKNFPGLKQAAQSIGSPQLRNVGTVGGNLCQRPRCWYFRAGFGLLARDESGRSLVLEGDNRYHAILGTDGPAYFVNPSSFAPALIAYGARVRIFGPRGAREVSLETFYRTPRSENEREYDLRSNELITDILIPPPTDLVSATYEVRQREALDWPLATASVALRMSGQRIESARVVLGHVAPVPWRSAEAERVIVGKTMSDALAEEAARAAVAPAKPLSQNAYKIHLARVAVKRALVQAARGRVR